MQPFRDVNYFQHLRLIPLQVFFSSLIHSTNTLECQYRPGCSRHVDIRIVLHYCEVLLLPSQNSEDDLNSPLWPSIIHEQLCNLCSSSGSVHTGHLSSWKGEGFFCLVFVYKTNQTFVPFDFASLRHSLQPLARRLSLWPTQNVTKKKQVGTFLGSGNCLTK